MSSDGRLENLVAQWAALREQGDEAAAEELCRNTPELLQRLQQDRSSLSECGPGEGTQADSTNSFPSDLAPVRDVSSCPAIPGYTFLERLGQGGIGAVFKVQDQQLGRVVALKVLRA